MSLNEQIQEQQKMLGRLLGADVAVQLALADDLLRVSADPASIDQVIVNLCINARDAMPEGGTLTIETENVTVSEAHRRQHPQATVGEHAILAVSDTGTGMEPAIKSRIFEPFFTTKEVGKGTGLGLSMVYGIVEAHKGWISVDSTPGEGTRFEVFLPTLPRTTGEGEAAEKSTPGNVEMGRGERILILEDEPELRERTGLMLEQRGYTVTACESLVEASEVCADGDGSYDLLIADVALADGRGPDFALDFMARFPQSSVVFMTGYSQETVHLLGNGGREIPILYKPFSVAALLDLIREELDRD